MFGFMKKEKINAPAKTAANEENVTKEEINEKEETDKEGSTRITKDMLVTDAMMLNPMVAPVLMQAGMYCFSCPASMGETIEEAAMVHGFDVDDILEAINSAVEEN